MNEPPGLRARGSVLSSVRERWLVCFLIRKVRRGGEGALDRGSWVMPSFIR